MSTTIPVLFGKNIRSRDDIDSGSKKFNVERERRNTVTDRKQALELRKSERESGASRAEVAEYGIDPSQESKKRQDRNKKKYNEMSIEKCQIEAEKGNLDAQYFLAHRLANGIGVEKNVPSAVKWYRKASESGSIDANVELAIILEEGNWVKKNEKEAFELYELAAFMGSPIAQYRIGVRFEKGQDIEQDLEKAAKWYRDAAKGGHAEAQYRLGWMFANGLGVKKDDKKAFYWYQKAANQGHLKARSNSNFRKDKQLHELLSVHGSKKEVDGEELSSPSALHKFAAQGNADAQYKLGYLYETGTAVSKDEEIAAKWYKKAAKQGHHLAQYYLGILFEEGIGVEKSETLAFDWYSKAAKGGLSEAHYKLGVMLEEGRGVEKDEPGAVKWYREAAKQGIASAQFRLGAMLKFGRGVAKDEKEAVKWYREAAMRGDVSAQYNLGVMHAKGQGVAQDDAEAVRWYRKAAEQKKLSAYNNLGVMYENGRGVKKDEKEAAEWYLKAAEKGHAGAQFNLGTLYENGHGVPKDIAKAKKWYSKASEQGDTDAKAALERLKLPSGKQTETSTLKSNTKESEEIKQEKETLTSIKQIPRKELKLGDLIGNGSYGDVYRGEWLGRTVAIKVLQLKTLTGMVLKDFKHEAYMMMKSQFPSIVQLYGICTEPGHFAMIMEYLPCSLRSRLQDTKDFPWPKRWAIALDIAQGLAYLHSQNIIHRDLKSLNILLDELDKAKIADFGLAKIKFEMSTTTKSSKVMGSTRWRAPELFKRHAVPTTASDVYSLGMIFWELASLKLPYAEAVENIIVMKHIDKGEKEDIPKDCPKEFAEIIKACWDEPENRPSAADIVKSLKMEMKKLNVTPHIQSPSSSSSSDTITTTDDAMLLEQRRKDLKRQLSEPKIQMGTQLLKFFRTINPGAEESVSPLKAEMQITSKDLEKLFESFAKWIEDRTNTKALQEDLESLKEKASQFETEISKLRAKTSKDGAISKRIAALERQAKPLLEEYEERQFTLKTQQYIKQLPAMLAFYNRVQLKLNQIFVAYMAISSGKINRGSDKTNITITLLGGILDILPLKLSIIADGINAVYNRRQVKKLRDQMDNMDNVVSITESDIVVERVARILTLRYADQIKETTLPRGDSFLTAATLSSEPSGGAQTLAECAVARIIVAFEGGMIHAGKPLDEQLIDSVFLDTKTHGKIPYMNKDIETTNKRGWTDSGIFRHSGIKLISKEWYVGEESEKEKGVCHKPGKYGYRWGMKEEVQRLKLIKQESPTPCEIPMLDSPAASSEIIKIHDDHRRIKEKKELEAVQQRVNPQQRQTSEPLMLSGGHERKAQPPKSDTASSKKATNGKWV